jgi:hypothetical protein
MYTNLQKVQILLASVRLAHREPFEESFVALQEAYEHGMDHSRSLCHQLENII